MSVLRKIFRDPFQRAVEQGPDKETLARETADLRPAGGLPTYWEDGATGKRFEGKPTSVIHTPTEQEVSQLGDLEMRHEICGFCRHFDLENGRKEIARQRFAERLVHDERWKLHHLGAPIDAIGLCGASGGDTATSFVAKGCDQFRRK